VVVGAHARPDRIAVYATALFSAAAVIAEIERAEAEAKRLIEMHKGAIIAFAARLFDRRRFDGDALDAVLREVGIEPAPRGE